MTLAVALVAAAGAIVFRIPAAETLFIAALRANGIPAPRLSVMELDWNSSHIGTVRLGQADEIVVGSVRLEYSPSGLLAGRLDRVTVDGLVIAVDLTGDAPPLGSLQTLVSGSDGGGGEFGRLPPLTLNDVQIDARTPAGIFRTTGGGQVQIADGGGISVDISLQEIMFDDRAIASGRLSGTLASERANATLALRGTAGSAVADVSAVIEDPMGAPVWRFNVAAEAGADSPLWAALSLPVPRSGHAKLTANGEGQALPLHDLTAADTQLLRLLANRAAGTLDVSVTDVSVQNHVTGLDARVQLTIDAADAANVALDGTLTLSVPQIADLEMTLPGTLRLDGNRIRGQLRKPAELRITELRHAGLAELLTPTVVTVAEAEAAMARDTSALDYRVTLNGPTLDLRLDTFDAAITPGQVTLTPGHIEIANAQIGIPAYGLAADGLSATVKTATDGTDIGFEIANLHQTDANPLIAPIAVTGQANRKGTVWKASATGAGPDGMRLFSAGSSHDTATARGKAHVVMEPLVFTPDGVQPGIPVPALSGLRRTTGRASGEADLVWTAQGVQGSGTLALADLSFDTPWARVAGLDLGLHLDTLIPPGSPPAQTLRIRRLEPGLPLDRLDIRFQIEPTTPPSLRIEIGEVHFGGGRLAVNDLVIDPAAARQHVDLRVENLSLAELFAILDLEGLSGDGLLSGAIPMDVADGILVIEKGRLTAGGPGVLKFRSEQAAQLLAGQGESLDLVLRALEDFHYDKLTVDLEKSADNVGHMTLGLLGKNPAVLEGHPFQFNINIEADTGKLVTALTTIFKVPNDFLRRTWTSAR